MVFIYLRFLIVLNFDDHTYNLQTFLKFVIFTRITLRFHAAMRRMRNIRARLVAITKFYFVRPNLGH